MSAVRFGLVCLLLFRATFSFAGTITPEMERDDPRLQTKVILVSPRAYVGEVLASLSRKTDMDISTEDKGVAGEELIISLKDATAAEAMRALTSLFGYKDAEWSWARTKGRNGKYRYSLSRRPSALTLPKKISEAIQASFEEQAADRLLGINASDSNFAGATTENVNSLKSSPRLVKGLTLFSEIFGSAERQKILRGEAMPDIAMTALKPAQQEFIRSLDGRDPGEPKSIRFERMMTIGEFTPTLFLLVDGAGYGYAGGVPLERKWGGRLAADWLLPGDTANSPLKETVQTTGGQDKANGADAASPPLNLFLRLSEKYNVSLMARTYNYQSLQITVGKNLGDLLKDWDEGTLRMASKWHEKTLLLMPRAVILAEPNTDPLWAAAQRSRDIQDNNPYHLPMLSDIAALASLLSMKGFDRLLQNEWGGGKRNAATSYYQLLHWIGVSTTHLERVSSNTGYKVSESITDILLHLPAIEGSEVGQRLLRKETVVLKVSDQKVLRSQPDTVPIAPDEKVSRVYEIQFYDRTGKLLSRSGFGMSNRFLPRNTL